MKDTPALPKKRAFRAPKPGAYTFGRFIAATLPARAKPNWRKNKITRGPYVNDSDDIFMLDGV